MLLYLPGTDSFPEDLIRNADRVFYFEEGLRANTKLVSKAYPKVQKSQTSLGGLDMILWPRRQRIRPPEPRISVNPRLLELQMAKEILAEVFHSRPGKVEKMIHNRLEERSWREEKNCWPYEVGVWPESLCLGE